MNQPSLFPEHEPRARATDPQTSHDAARSVRHSHAATIRRQVLRLLAASAIPMTDEEIADAWPADVPASPSGIRTRRSELVADGLVTAAQSKGRTRAGRECTRWQIAA